MVYANKLHLLGLSHNDGADQAPTFSLVLYSGLKNTAKLCAEIKSWYFLRPGCVMWMCEDYNK